MKESFFAQSGGKDSAMALYEIQMGVSSVYELTSQRFSSLQPP